MLRAIYITILTVLFTFATNGFGQIYNFRNFSIQHGLAQSQVYGICQDHNNNMWFGTMGGGVTKYDGHTAINYSIEQGLPSYSTFSMLCDRNGTIWAGTKEGAAYFDGKKFVPIFADSLSTETVFSMVEQPNGNLLFLTENKLWETDGTSIKSVGTSFGSQTPLYYAPDSSIVMVTNKGLRTNTKLVNKVLNLAQVQGESIKKVYYDSNNTLWFCTYAGLIRVPEDMEPTHYGEKFGIKYSSFIDIIEDSDNNLWLASDIDGLLLIKNDSLIRIPESEGVVYNYVLRVFEDRQNNIWVTTDGSGVSLFKGFLFTQYRFEAYLKNPFFMAMFVDSENNKWVGTDGSGLIAYNDTEIKPYNKKNGLISNNVLNIAEDTYGRIWVATDFGISVIDGKKITNYTHKNSALIAEMVLGLAPDKKGGMYAATNGGGITYFGKNKQTTYHSGNGMISDNVWDVHVAHNGILYAATNVGLAVYDGNEFKQYTTKDGMPNNSVISITENKDGKIWFATDNGICSFTNDTIVCYTKADGLNSYITYLLEFTNDNHLVVGNERGIDVVRFSNEGTINDIHFYGRAEGFSGIECNANAVSKDKDGKLWIGTVNGAMLFDPKSRTVNTHEPSTFINNIRLFFSKTKWEENSDSINHKTGLPINLKLPHWKKHLTFDFISTNYYSPEKVRYKYMLEGFDDDWSPGTAHTYATYSNLPPGSYTFNVIACNEDRFWNETATTFSFLIKTPFYKTISFYVFCVIIGVLILFIIIHIRTRSLRKSSLRLEMQVIERTKEISAQNKTLTKQHNEIQTQKNKIEAQHNFVTKQRDEIEQQQNNIKDSILYASRIQKAILPQSSDITSLFADSFIFFKPRDIVSGDFYWLYKHQNKVFFAVADCTGHGVPGGFMSVLSISTLNQLALKNNYKLASEILNDLLTMIIKALHQKQDSVSSRDAIEMAVCIIDTHANQIQYAGAYNNLLIKRKTETILHEVKADRMPVGVYVGKTKPYTNHTIKLNKGDTIYMYTDGITDQFGGTKKRKYLYKNLKSFLLKLSTLPFTEQNELIAQEFEQWKGDNRQLDDVLVVGLKM